MEKTVNILGTEYTIEPRELKDEDIDKMSVHLSNSKLYHCFGDAICVPVLSAIFEQML